MKLLNLLLAPFQFFGRFIAKIMGKTEKPKSTSKEPKKFSTFEGVFTPTVLTILGVIMYLRQPWVVGNAGVFGAVLIILLAISITLCTALSMASMTTNIRIGRGGAFSIISQSLGLEVGGSIGLPLYFSQAFAVAMYVFGFREGVEWLIQKMANDPQSVLSPTLSWIINFGTFIVVYAIVKISTNFAFKIQYVLMGLVGASILSILGGLLNVDVAANWENIRWVGDFDGGESSFWIVFAVFFPAVTGIMAGANMSGELKDPRKAIPTGTLGAVALTGVVYIALILVAALLADRNDLISDYNIFIDRSYWWPVVILGLLGATFSSALASLVGAPRILAALGEFNILPKSEFFAKTNKKGEPENAVMFTGIIVFISLLAGDLNAIAPLITMFFMITYAMINIVVVIEQSLGLPSFRPTLKIHILIPLLGALGCIFVMFIINAIFALVSMGLVIAFYWYLLKRDLKGQKGDARSGLFTALAGWATKKSNELSPKKEARAWQPELLLPIEHSKELRGVYRLLYALTYPKGSLKVLGMKGEDSQKSLESDLPNLMQTFNDAEIVSSYSYINGNDYGKIVGISMQALQTAFFTPNTVFLKLDERAATKTADYQSIVNQAQAYNWGAIFFAQYETGLGIEKTINVWLNDIPSDWEEQLDLGNNDLAVLLGLIIRKSWDGRINLVKVVDDENLTDEVVLKKLEHLKEIARISKETAVHIIRKSDTMWASAPPADLNIMGVPNEDLNVMALKDISAALSTSCVFTIDSGEESALV